MSSIGLDSSQGNVVDILRANTVQAQGNAGIAVTNAPITAGMFVSDVPAQVTFLGDIRPGLLSNSLVATDATGALTEAATSTGDDPDTIVVRDSLGRIAATTVICTDVPPSNMLIAGSGGTMTYIAATAISSPNSVVRRDGDELIASAAISADRYYLNSPTPSRATWLFVQEYANPMVWLGFDEFDVPPAFSDYFTIVNAPGTGTRWTCHRTGVYAVNMRVKKIAGAPSGFAFAAASNSATWAENIPFDLRLVHGIPYERTMTLSRTDLLLEDTEFSVHRDDFINADPNMTLWIDITIVRIFA